MYHHTKNKGDLGVLKAKCDLYEKGYLVLVPETEHSPFDIVVYKNGEFKTIQVKYRSVKNESISIGFCSFWADRNGCHAKPVDKNIIDLYCVYIPELDECFYFNPKDFNKYVTFRVSPTKNNQKSGINMISNYREVP